MVELYFPDLEFFVFILEKWPIKTLYPELDDFGKARWRILI